MTHTKNKLVQLLGTTLAASTFAVSAGDDLGLAAPSAVGGNTGDWADTLKNIGKVYKNKSNPYIQEVKFFGRAHYQWGYTDGENGGDSFSGNGDELRRLRFGTSIKFLNGFKLVGRANFTKGSFRDVSIGYDSMDELYLSYSFGESIAGFEDVSLGYGRYKVAFGGEEHISSKKIKTIERSNLNNHFAPGRATGGVLKFKTAGIGVTAGLFSSDEDQTLGQWNGDNAVYASLDFKALNGEVTLDYLNASNVGAFEDTDWAASLTYNTSIGNWDLLTNFTYGDDGNENVYGVVIMPSTYLIEDKLEAVFRYQWAHATGDVLQATSRYARRIYSSETGGSLPGGDDNHTFYAGLNYFLSGHHAKVMLGVEYETLDGDTTDVEATTVWTALRMYF